MTHTTSLPEDSSSGFQSGEPAPVASNRRIVPLEAVGILFLLLVAISARLYNFWEAPFLGFVDVGAHAEATLKLLGRLRAGEWVPPWELGWGNVPHFYWYTLAPFFLVFDPPILAQKVAAFSFSIIALAMTYLFLRDLGGPLLAFLGTHVFVFSRFYLFYSRYPMEPIDLYLFFIASLYAFRRGVLNTSTVRSLIFLGISALLLAAGQHLYLAARVLLPFFAAYFLILRWGENRIHQSALKAGWFFILLALFLIPLTLTYYRDQQALVVRHQEIGAVGALPPSELAGNFVKTFRFFIDLPDPSPAQNLASEPMIQPAVAVLFVLGLIAIPFLRKEPMLLAGALLLCCLPATALTIEPTNSKRLLNGMLAVSILAAYPSTLLFRRWADIRWLPPLGIASVVVAVAAFGARDFKILFVDFNENPRNLSGTGYPQVKYAEQVIQLSDESDLFISPNRDKPQSASFHPRLGPSPFNPSLCIPFVEPPDRNAVLLLEEKQDQWLPLLTHFYPSASIQRIDVGYRYGFTRYDVPLADVEASFGLIVSDSSDEAGVVTPWESDSIGTSFEPGTAHVHFTGLVFCDGFLGVDFDGRGRVRMRLDGKDSPWQRCRGATSFRERIPHPGWREFTLIFEPAADQRDCVLKRSRAGNVFVAAESPPGLRCIGFKDRDRRTVESLSFVPVQQESSYFSGHPDGFAVYSGTIHLEQGGTVDVLFDCDSSARIQVGNLLDETVEPKTGVARRLELQAGAHPFLLAVEMKIVRAVVPNYSISLTPVQGAGPIAWRASGPPVEDLIQEVRGWDWPTGGEVPN